MLIKGAGLRWNNQKSYLYKTLKKPPELLLKNAKFRRNYFPKKSFARHFYIKCVDIYLLPEKSIILCTFNEKN